MNQKMFTEIIPSVEDSEDDNYYILNIIKKAYRV